MEKEALIPKLSSLWVTRREEVKKFLLGVLVTLLFLVVGSLFIIGVCILAVKDEKEKENYVPDITIPSMDLTVLNINETRLSLKWDLLIRIPGALPGFYTCLEGDFQVFIVYKGVTIATSSIESYNLRPLWSKLLKISLIASEDQVIDGMIVKDIMEDIKERGEMRFGSRLLLPDCRYGTSGKMNYSCDEATLRLAPGSQRNATLFGKQPICHYIH